MINTKAQAWGMDIIIAVMIFSVGIIIFLIYTVNQSTESKEKLELLKNDGDFIFKNILSEGYPEDWNSLNVIKIGILSNDKINETKLQRFYNFSQSDYDRTKSLFNTEYNYLFYFENITIDSTFVNGIGKPGVSVTNIDDNAVDLIKITRLTTYREKLVTVYLYVWDE